MMLQNMAAVNIEKKRKDYAFRRQCNEKPSIILGCPGAVNIPSMEACWSEIAAAAEALPLPTAIPTFAAVGLLTLATSKRPTHNAAKHGSSEHTFYRSMLVRDCCSCRSTATANSHPHVCCSQGHQIIDAISHIHHSVAQALHSKVITAYAEVG